MRLTSALMEAMGCGKQAIGAGWYYCLKMDGYQFYFHQSSNDDWVFSTPSGIKHSVTDIEECFGMIQVDATKDGYKECKRELRNFLEIRDD